MTERTGDGAGGTDTFALPTAQATEELAFRYDARLAGAIESRWQDRWQAEGTFATPNPVGDLSTGYPLVANLPRFFIMDMFPYPSGSGLHVGHPLGYIGTDVLARFRRMTGHNVLHTLGYDAFGLPAEQYAINTGQHPAVTTAANIENMRRQLRRLGLGHDSRREIATADPAYYRWTQWIFLKIFNSWYDTDADRARPIEELIAEFAAGSRAPGGPAGPPWERLSDVERRTIVDSHRLAYISEQLVNWCPGLGTVLANEEVTADGRSDIGNYPVFRRPLRQWVLRITAYAQRLIDDLEHVDWPDSIKQMQRNWIGASDGASVVFPFAGASPGGVEVFTTRPDTLPGATFLVLAPEHPLVAALTADAWPAGTPEEWRYPQGIPAGDPAAGWTPRAAVAAYQQQAERLGDRTRGEADRERSGVFTGSYVRNPTTGAEVPVFLADYVLMGYGTGAIMAVPAHDQRDFEFALALSLPITAVISPSGAWCEEHGVAPDADPRTWPEAFAGEGSYLPQPPPAPPLTGLSKAGAVAATVAWLAAGGHGRGVRTYRLRDWLFSRQRYWGEPFPIVYDETGLPIALPEDALPVTLPEMTDFRPAAAADDDASDPVPPLARAGDWVNVTLDLGDGPKRYRRETNTMPQWAGSCWYHLRYLDPTNVERFVDPSVERYWLAAPDAAPGSGDGGVDLYVGGVEHAVLHLLYARFWQKVLYDLGLVSTREPFRRLFNQGYIQADAFTDARGMYVAAPEVVRAADGGYYHQGQPVTRRAGKMGKSLKNSVSPDEMYAQYGADTLRVYEMSMGPLDADRPWHTDDIIGSHRFLQRLWRNIVDEGTGAPSVVETPLDDEGRRRLHRTIDVVRTDYENLRFNTAVARLTELTNYASKRYAGTAPRELAEALTLMVAPLAPHIAEDLWARLGHPTSLVREPFPDADPDLLVDETVTLPVQVNGKVRFTLAVPAGAAEHDVRALLTETDDYRRHTEGRTVARVIVVPGRIVNIAVK
jgi:leucyl-tRNA synthetase